MRIVLAGYNLDSSVIEELKRQAPPRGDVTPETLSAAYARISRDPRPADELRAAARLEVDKARRSNQAIIFRMGHHSVAEHAVFNFDIIGASRLALEEIERFRLVSYTEKSQRYITLGDDFVIPREIVDAGAEELFVATVREQNALYHRLYEKLRPCVFEKHARLAANPKNHAVLEGWAKEDARYAVSLATEGQVGLTINARNLELLIRRFAASRLAEPREIGRTMFDLAREVAPSLILFTEPTGFDALTYGEIAAASDGLGRQPAESRVQGTGGGGEVTDPAGPVGEGGPGGSENGGRAAGRKAAARRVGVRLVDFTPAGDDRILAALLHSISRDPYDRCLAAIQALGRPEKKSLFKTALSRLEFYDFPLREFEYADLTFAAEVSASCFAQLKRHRMATLTAQDYDPALGVSVPPSIREVGAAGEFRALIKKTEAAHRSLQDRAGAAADYVLTNAHRRRVLLKVNVRELYHISRLRQDPTAQWEIRKLTERLSALAKEVMPLSTLLLGGKDQYPAIYQDLFGRAPKAIPPGLLK